MDRVATMHALIAQQRSLGLNPQEIHCNAETRRDFAHEAGLVSKPAPDPRSPMARLMGLGTPPEAILEFDGVRLVTNEEIPGAAIILRPQQLMGDPAWLSRVKFRPEQPKPPADGSTPWFQRSEVSEPQQESTDGPVTAESLADGAGINPSSVLFTAFDDIEKVKDVVVLRFHKNGDVSLCATIDRMAIVGALQMAMGYVLGNPD